jgi:hypothetical protein
MANSNNPAHERETRLADSDRQLLAHLERLTGRRIKSRQDISDYVSEPLANGRLGRS